MGVKFSVADAVAREREAFAATTEKTDPDAPTLCEGWAVRDLLAHLVIRDRRPDWRSPVCVVLRRPDGAEHRVHRGLPGPGRPQRRRAAGPP